MSDLILWDCCDTHEIAFLRSAYCKDCRIADLEAKLEAIGRLPDEWNKRHPFFTNDVTRCADQLGELTKAEDES